MSIGDSGCPIEIRGDGRWLQKYDVC